MGIYPALLDRRPAYLDDGSGCTSLLLAPVTTGSLICELHARLVDNLRLGMSVFLNGSVRDAQKLLEEKARFRDLERAYAGTHLERLSANTVQSQETSSLHIDLISELKRINSHICSIAYPILETAGALSKTRIRHSQLASLSPEDR